MKKWIIGILFLVVIFIVIGTIYVTRNSENQYESFSSNSSSKVGEITDGSENSEEKENNGWKESVSVDQLTAERIGKTKIKLVWPDSLNEIVTKYSVERCNAQDLNSSWTEIASLSSDGIVHGGLIEVIDELSTEDPKQYLYRVQVSVVDDENWKAENGTQIAASNFLICIDPGHYGSGNAISSGYVEGKATLKIALALQENLKKIYGIDSYLTRTGEDISLGGYTNQELDKAHLSLRGSYAGERDSNLFLSLHTNANLSNANGYPTESQPISINKPVLIANQIAGYDQVGVSIANEIGTELANVNYSQGLSTVSTFDEILPGGMVVWTDAYNDSLNCPGTVFERLQDSGEEYYGVLRGASEAGVMGLIIEHGMHTVPEVRSAISEGSLVSLWAEADAKGIAEALGFVEVPTV